MTLGDVSALSKRFKGKVALIVGAGSGIAAACAKIVAIEGGIVFGVDKDAVAAQSIEQKLSEAGASCKFCAADALVADEVTAAVDQVVASYGRIDILVNAIGGSTIVQNMNSPLEDLSLLEWHKLVDFNLLPTFLFCKAVIPIMKKQRSGKIVNISSHAAYGIEVSTAAYAASKAGVIGLTKKLALELGPFGINCNAIAPSRTLTDRVLREVETAEGNTSKYLNAIPLRRFATAEDQAKVICFLASEDADYITGTTIDVTGGQ